MAVRKRKRQVERKSIHSIQEVYNAVKDDMDNYDKTQILFDGDYIKANSQRYQVFFHKGMTCVNCGITGKFFAKERNPGHKSYHLNLYGVDNYGNEVLMTKDHIIPRSKGGTNKLENYQCMCVKCNLNKGNNFEG